MAEDPLRQLSRLAAGIVLMQGRLGHQVLGQLLLMDTSEIAMAGAAIAVAASSGPRNEVLQVTLRTVVPTIAGHVVLKKREDRVARKQELLEEREKEVEHLRKENERLLREVHQCRQQLVGRRP